jgi:hypothetical protein
MKASDGLPTVRTVLRRVHCQHMEWRNFLREAVWVGWSNTAVDHGVKAFALTP